MNNAIHIDVEANTYTITSKVAYLIGIPEIYFTKEKPTFCEDVYQELEGKSEARNIRDLCIIRNGFMREFKQISFDLESNLKNIDSVPQYIPPIAVQRLVVDGVPVRKTNCKAIKYLAHINSLIAQIIIKCKEFFPIWVKWEYIKSLFVMPNGDKETGITGEQTKFKQFYNLYPFQTYINWKPVDAGNILYNDAKFLTWLYKSHGDSFREYEFVSDASQLGKYNIHSFIKKAQKIDIVVDCENSDPYKTEAMIKSLSPEEKFSVQRILLFDDVNANKAWQFVSSIIEIPVKRIVVERVSRLKSQVDMRLAVEVCKEFYENEVDSFILMTSDSDYWSLISSLPSASFIVVIEDGQTSKRLIQTYEEHKIPYCWLDDFCMGRAMELKQLALKSEINNRLKSMCKINFAYMIENSSRAIWTTFSESEKIEILKSCKKGLRASIDSDGNLALSIE